MKAWRNLKPRSLTVKDYVYVARTAACLHVKSFTRGGLTKEDWKNDEQEDPAVEERAQPCSVEEIALAARAGAEHVKPALQRIYMEGYQEGVAEVMAKNSQAEPSQGSTEAEERTTRSSPVEDARNHKLPF